jgi:hypothetical protein
MEALEALEARGSVVLEVPEALEVWLAPRSGHVRLT